MSGKQAVSFTKEKELEAVIPMVVYREIPEGSHTEMICAQAILVRSRFQKRVESGEKIDDLYEQILRENLQYEENYSVDKNQLQRCIEATELTEGYVLYYGGQVVEGPFCRASNGWTRSGKEVLGKAEYGWLVGVESKADLDYKAKRKPVVFSEEVLRQCLKGITGKTTEEDKTIKSTESIEDSETAETGESTESIENSETAETGKNTSLESDETLRSDKTLELAVIAKDSAGYVTELEIGGNRISGEAFRQALNLPSASFTYIKEGENWQFSCRGEGHGMGMSQYGANAMAKEGKDWRDILDYYFPTAQVEKK